MAKAKYRLRIPPDARCAVCGQQGTRVLNLRMRRADTGADWGPNINGLYFCAVCAIRGMDVYVEVMPNVSGVTKVSVACGDATAQRVVEKAEQEQLWNG